jgi:hypothetical protein
MCVIVLICFRHIHMGLVFCVKYGLRWNTYITCALAIGSLSAEFSRCYDISVSVGAYGVWDDCEVHEIKDIANSAGTWKM